MDHLEIRQFICRNDNCGVLIHDPDTGATASIDAPDSEAVLRILSDEKWSLTHILVTHHHHDHTTGIQKLKEKTKCTVVGPASEAHAIPSLDKTVKDGGTVQCGCFEIHVLETPGHTAGHVVYHMDRERILFCGDTLFAMGCGRLFEGDARTMWSGLQKLAALPAETAVYCGHDYTHSNALFALSVDPENQVLQDRARKVKAQSLSGKLTLPTTIGLELDTNPFLRVENQRIRAFLGLETAQDWEVFAALRRKKDCA